MNFDFSDDQKMLKETASNFLKEHAPLALCRAVLESDQSYSAELWKKAAELGWQATAIPEDTRWRPSPSHRVCVSPPTQS
jgi:alkylation response protein AidB-like acyl-CoA dehydrogenase